MRLTPRSVRSYNGTVSLEKHARANDSLSVTEYSYTSISYSSAMVF